jgi:hypothetical protein
LIFGAVINPSEKDSRAAATDSSPKAASPTAALINKGRCGRNDLRRLDESIAVRAIKTLLIQDQKENRCV